MTSSLFHGRPTGGEINRGKEAQRGQIRNTLGTADKRAWQEKRFQFGCPLGPLFRERIWGEAAVGKGVRHSRRGVKRRDIIHLKALKTRKVHRDVFWCFLSASRESIGQQKRFGTWNFLGVPRDEKSSEEMRLGQGESPEII